MKWKRRLALLALSAIPAFTGYPLRQMDMTVIEGIEEFLIEEGLDDIHDLIGSLKL